MPVNKNAYMGPPQGILREPDDGFTFRDYSPPEMNNRDYLRGLAPEANGMLNGSMLDSNFKMDYGQEAYDPFAAYEKQDASQAGASGWEGAKNFMFGSTNEQTGVRTRSGLLPILNTFTGLASAYLGMKQYGLAKDSFKQNKKEFGMNYDAQRQTTNAQMEGQAKARYSANPNFYESPTDYMDKNSIAARTA